MAAHDDEKTNGDNSPTGARVNHEPIARRIAKELCGAAWTLVPGVVVGIAFLALFAYRRDYLGHYAAGYGATLAALAVALGGLSGLRPEWYERWSAPIVVVLTMLCILAGVYTEATVFRLAKFDEIDFCNQSLGAVLAGLAALSLAGKTKASDSHSYVFAAAGIGALMIGSYFAVT